MNANALNIKEIRNNLGLTQKEIAKQLGLGLKTVTNYESGTPIPLSTQKLITLMYLKKKETATDLDNTKREIANCKQLQEKDNKYIESLEKRIETLDILLADRNEKINTLMNMNTLKKRDV